MKSSPAFGLFLAAFGALVLTPDALLMRISGMHGLQMVGWRGLFLGGLFLAAWMVTSRNRRSDIASLTNGAGAIIVLSQFVNALLFANGIALAPVSVVLISIATVPLCAAAVAWAIYGERTSLSTWTTIAVVLVGIVIAVTGTADIALHKNSLLGALCGLGVAFALALTFVTLRHNPHVPILLAVGAGAVLAGVTGTVATGFPDMLNGRLWAIAFTGLIILPTSFFALTLASRYTSAANVSLLMLLETVLGPVWVWVGLGERPTIRMFLGGAIVVGALTLYLWYGRHRAKQVARAKI